MFGFLSSNTSFTIGIVAWLFIPAVSATTGSALIDKGMLDPENTIYLEQNWSQKDREWFYHADQGSRLVPYNLFLVLEQAANNQLFRDPVNLLRYGLIPARSTSQNPDNLPIGFSRNEDALGLTCAACHTQQLKYEGKYIRIDGGQPMFDLQYFLADLEQAMQKTLSERDKLERFIARYQTIEKQFGNKEITDLMSYEHAKLADHIRRNHTNVAYGYTRLDAFGAILNKGLSLTGVKDNFISPNAPTSYPYIWDTPQHDYVEWNGSQSNSGPGALARNVGEVIGVFGHVNVEPTKRLFYFDGGYESSIQTKNLRKLEKKISHLYSPLWPDILPAIDHAQLASGEKLYAQYCRSCHTDFERTNPDRKIQVRLNRLETIGTDPLMATNVLSLKGRTGIFEGKKRFYKFGETMGAVAPALFIVNHVMVGVLQNNPLQVFLAKRDSKALGHVNVGLPDKIVDAKLIKKGEESSEYALLAYKARPLNGIWTAAPYLHNGSVPNLYQLLLPASERVQTFYIGSWEFDPVDVGYVSDNVPGAFLFNTRLPGNSNAGHEYGTGYDGLPRLQETQIRALIEYLKSL